VQPVLPVPIPFARQACSGRALGDAAEDQEDLRRAAVGLGDDGLGEGVEDPAARAAVVQDRVTGLVVDPKPVATLAAGAGQAAGVEQIDECGVADVLIERVEQGEVHGRDLRASSCIPLGHHRSEPSSRGGAPNPPHEPKPVTVARRE
jgi:hypothetical protein